MLYLKRNPALTGNHRAAGKIIANAEKKFIFAEKAKKF